MASIRRAARGTPIVEILEAPRHLVQQSMQKPGGVVRAWFKGGICYRVLAAGNVYGWGEGPAVWAAVLDGSFRPDNFGKRNRRQ